MGAQILTVGTTRWINPPPEGPEEAAEAFGGDPFAQLREPVPPARVRLGDAARQEEKRRRLIEFLERETPAWKDADHPEIEAAGGPAEWVRKIRRGAEDAFERRIRPRGDS